LLIWPYAVAPAVAAILWLFLFNPTLGVVAHWLKGWASLGPAARRQRCADHGRDRRGVEADQLQLPVLPRGLQSIPKSLIEAAAIDGAGPVKRFVTIVFPLLSPTTFFLLVVNIVYAFFDTFGIIDASTERRPGEGDQHPGLQGVRGRLQGARPRRIGCPVGRADVHRHQPDRRAVPVRREKVQY
jgi:sn-glycerol 3-phosphate transport system permease protein